MKIMVTGGAGFVGTNLIKRLLKDGHTVVIIEHNQDVICQAHWIIDVGPTGGKQGGKVVFSGSVDTMIESSATITAEHVKKHLLEYYQNAEEFR